MIDPVPDESVQKLLIGTNLGEVKELADDFVLSRGGEIEEAEAWLKFFLENLEAGRGKLTITSGQTLDALKFDNYKTGQKVDTINTERAEQKKQSGFDVNKFIFPTDIISIISGIVEVLRERGRFSSSELAGFYRDPTNRRNEWVYSWADEGGVVSEEKLLRNSYKIIDLIKIVQAALQEYKTRGARPPEGYIRQSDAQEKILEIVVPEIIKRAAAGTDAGTEQLEKIKVLLTEALLKDNHTSREFFNKFFSEDDVKNLLEIDHKEGKKVAIRFPGEDGTYFVEDFTETAWFNRQKDPAILWFLRKYEARLKEIIANPEEIEESIDLEKPEPAQVQEEEAGGPEYEESTRERPAEVVPVPTPQIVDAFTQFTRPSSLRETNSDDFKSRVRYETTWISNRALFEIFAANGIDVGSVDPNLVNFIQNETLTMLAGYSDSELAMLFASPSHRQRAVLELFGKINSRPDYVKTINSIFLANNVQEILSLRFDPNKSPKDIFVNEIKRLSRVAGQETQLNETVIANALNRLDAIILSYGLNDLLLESERESHKDAIWFIQNLDPAKLGMIFFPQLDPQVAEQLVTSYQSQLKTLLVNYVRIRGYELVLQTNNSATGRGLLGGVSQDDQKAMTGDSQSFIAHFASSTHPMGDVQEFAKDRGAGLSAAAFVYTPGGSRAQAKIDEIYKTFLPAWESLDQETQIRIYQTFGFEPGSRYTDGTSRTSLPFLFNFIFLTKEEIEVLRNPPQVEGRENYVLIFDDSRAEEARRYQEFLIAGVQAEALGRKLQAIYSSLTDDVVQEQASEISGGTENSVQDLYQADSGQRPRGLLGQIPFGDRITGSLKKAANRKLKATFEKKALDAVVSKAGPWAFLLSMLRTKKGRKQLAIGGSILALGLARALYNMLHSVGGFLGGLGGGFAGFKIGAALGAQIGFVVGGPVGAAIGGAIGGVIGAIGGGWLGSEVGSRLLPQSLGFGGGSATSGLGAGGIGSAASGLEPGGFEDASGASGSSVLARPIPEASTSVVSPAATAGRSGGLVTNIGNFLATLPVAILAPSIMIILVVTSTITTLNIIRNAFLVSAPFGGVLLEAIETKKFECKNASFPKPTSANVIYSTDGEYAFPMDATFNNMSCHHHGNVLITDIFTQAGSSIDTQLNLPIIAYEDSTVYTIVFDATYGGIYIILRSDKLHYDSNNDGVADQPRWYYYAHNCTVFVEPGQSVSVGEIIAVSNQTGLNAAITPEHLHFGIQVGGSSPDFEFGGNLCPNQDFAEKFGETAPEKNFCDVGTGVWCPPE